MADGQRVVGQRGWRRAAPVPAPPAGPRDRCAGPRSSPRARLGPTPTIRPGRLRAGPTTARGRGSPGARPERGRGPRPAGRGAAPARPAPPRRAGRGRRRRCAARPSRSRPGATHPRRSGGARGGGGRRGCDDARGGRPARSSTNTTRRLGRTPSSVATACCDRPGLAATARSRPACAGVRPSGASCSAKPIAASAPTCVRTKATCAGPVAGRPTAGTLRRRGCRSAVRRLRGVLLAHCQDRSSRISFVY